MCDVVRGARTGCNVLKGKMSIVHDKKMKQYLLQM